MKQYPNLHVVDRPEGSIVVRNKKGQLVAVFRKTGETAYLVFEPSCPTPTKVLAESIDRCISILEWEAVEGKNPGTPQKAFLDFMIGSR